ncbi:GNAT family N-acetyltransferase [Deinococcus sp. HMF7620]|uniref:GNAT family N-acetyltransferase n=1 Tax=Deinococcus arboris TaxID=2682977 RepID=A0A7C9LJS2_9DEIO|nr:GNAT family N-acetyltransferase [Deinococcus arboris]MVN85257.1 GNAT family N-acetyltransferase [Deinococcus arboris]
MPLPPDALARLARAEAQAHQADIQAAFGPLRAAYAGPGLPLNSAWHGGGLSLTNDDLAAFEAFCALHDQLPLIHLLSPEVMPSLPLLRARGYQCSGLLHAYLHDLTDLPPQPTHTQETADRLGWAALSAQGFGESSATVMTVVAQNAQTRLFVATRGGQPAGSAALKVTDNVAALFGMSTRPEARGQGVQTELLSARLHAAALAGATLASVFVTPGTPSERNIGRAGFQLAGARLSFTQFREA